MDNRSNGFVYAAEGAIVSNFLAKDTQLSSSFEKEKERERVKKRWEKGEQPNRLLIRTIVVIGQIDERGKITLPHRQDPEISDYFTLGLGMSLLVRIELICRSFKYLTLKFVLMHM